MQMQRITWKSISEQYDFAEAWKISPTFIGRIV